MLGSVTGTQAGLLDMRAFGDDTPSSEPEPVNLWKANYSYDYEKNDLTIELYYSSDSRYWDTSVGDLYGSLFDFHGFAEWASIMLYKDGNHIGEYWRGGWIPSEGDHTMTGDPFLLIYNLRERLPEGRYQVQVPEGLLTHRHPLADSPGFTMTVDLCRHSAYDSNGYCTTCGSTKQPEVDANDNYVIANKGNLIWYADNQRDDFIYKHTPQKSAILVNDITVNSDWEPIGLDGVTFDGNGHSVSGIRVSDVDKDIRGFFGYIHNSTVKNLTIINSSIDGYKYVGGIAGYAMYSNIINCHNAANVTGTKYPGGIVGDLIASSVESCLNTGKVVSREPRYSGAKAICEGEAKYCVNLSGCVADDAISSHDVECYTVSQDELRNGGAAYLLNNGIHDGTQGWYQKIGTDELPHPFSRGGDTVYGGYKHGSSASSMSNTPVDEPLHLTPFCSTATSEECGGHGYSMVDGVCQVCGMHCEHPSYTNGICDECQYHCPHSAHEEKNGFRDYCTICNIDMTSMYVPAPLASDGYYEVNNGGQLYWVFEKGVSKIRLVKDIVVNENVLNPDGTLRNAAAMRTWSVVESKKITFDGQGHTVSGLYGESMFGDLRTCVIENVGIIDSYFTVSSFASYDYGRSSLSDSYSLATVEGSAAMVSGLAFETSIRNCYYAGKCDGAGFCNRIIEVTLSNCYTTCSCIYNEESYNEFTEHSTLTNCSKGVSLEDFASGRITFLLNGKKTDGTQKWYQRLGQDKFPLLMATGNNTVYLQENCQGTKVYENVDPLDEGKHLYDKDSGLCKYCGQGKPCEAVNDIYEIYNVGNLCWFRELTEENPTVNARLMKDITDNTDPCAVSARTWQPIGEVNPYSGTFDGQRHSIKGLYGKSLFKNVRGAHISHLGVENSNLENGILAVQVSNRTLIEGCYAKNVRYYDDDAPVAFT